MDFITLNGTIFRKQFQLRVITKRKFILMGENYEYISIIFGYYYCGYPQHHGYRGLQSWLEPATNLLWRYGLIDLARAVQF